MCVNKSDYNQCCNFCSVCKLRSLKEWQHSNRSEACFFSSWQEHKITNHIYNLPHNSFSLSSPFKGHQKWHSHKTWIRLRQVWRHRRKFSRGNSIAIILNCPNTCNSSDSEQPKCMHAFTLQVVTDWNDTDFHFIYLYKCQNDSLITYYFYAWLGKIIVTGIVII